MFVAGHGGVELRHDEDAEEVEDGRHDDGGAYAHASRGHAGGDGVGCVGPAVDEDDSQRQQRCDGQSRVGKHLLEEMRQ